MRDTGDEKLLELTSKKRNFLYSLNAKVKYYISIDPEKTEILTIKGVDQVKKKYLVTDKDNNSRTILIDTLNVNSEEVPEELPEEVHKVVENPQRGWLSMFGSRKTGGKRKTTRRKSNRRKSNRRKSNRRKSNRRKTNRKRK